MSAPLSGRPCLGYEVVVAWHDPSRGGVGALALVEQRVGGLSIGSEVLPPRRTHLRMQRERIELETPRREHVGQYLRARGLDPADGAFDLFETILEPNARVDVLRSGDLFEVRPLDP